MIKVSSIVLTAALFGRHGASAANCYAPYTGSGSYYPGDVASREIEESCTKDKDIQGCNTATPPCCGDKDSTSGTKDVYYDFKCTDSANSVFCGTYDPATATSSVAWTKLAACVSIQLVYLCGTGWGASHTRVAL